MWQMWPRAPATRIRTQLDLKVLVLMFRELGFSLGFVVWDFGA